MLKRLLKRPSLNLLAWLLLAAFYISICLNIAFFKQVLQALPLDSLHNVLVFLSMPVVAFSVINIVLTLSSFLWLNRPLACLFILVGAAAQYFIMTYGIVIDRSMIANIIDTTPAESYALMTPQMLLTLGFSGVLAALIACWIKIKPAASRLRSVLFRGANILVSVLLILLVAALFYKDYASLFRNNKELVKSLSPSNSIVASWSWYSHQRLANLPLVRIGEDAHRNPLMQNEKRKNLTILIVGETSRAENFSLNGYPRETNPRLAKDNVVYFPATSRLRSVLFRGANILVSVLLILLVAALFYKDYASLFRNNKELVKSLSPSNSIVASWSWYSHQRLANLPLVRIGEDAHRNPLMQNEKRKNLTILIVGETSRAENFSLHGYPRETNPRLAKDNVVYFPNTASCGTATAVSVPCMFSDMPREHYKEELAQHQEGVLDIIQRAGINVLWNDNDGGCKGVCDRVPHQNVTALNLPGQCINGECYDEVLFHGLEDYINNLQGDGVIVLHTIGSHGPTYYNRYPPQFRKFTPTCDTNEIQTCTKEQLVNTYDNTLVYVDYIVDKAINLLKEHQDKFTTSLVYLSDHGESLGENGIYLHGLPYAIAPDSQKQVPMLLWLSEDYQKRYQVDQNCLQKQAQTQHYSQDNLFSTLLGLTGVETKYYQAADDILQTCRRVSE